ncbi:MAG: hypothetical protein ACRDV1_04870 [Actinomycetes bacterium]
MRHAAPALLAYAAVRALGLAVLLVWSSIAGRDAHLGLVRWDAQWYAGIARDGYGFTRIHEDGRSLSDLAFFPLFPWLERVVSEATGLRHVDAGLVVSWVASLVAAWGIFAVGDHLYGRRVGILLTVLWAALPIGIVASMAYSESLFTALAAWTLYAVLTGRWVWAGVLAASAGLTRPVGVAVAAAVMIPAAVTMLKGTHTSTTTTPDGPPPARSRVMAGALIAPLGWLGYVGWVGIRTGDPVGYLEVADRWGNGFDGGAAFLGWIGGFLMSSAFMLGLAVCAGLVLLGLLCLLCVRARQPLPLMVFCGALLFLALTTSGYFGSKPRLLMPAFPLLLPVAVALARMRPARAAWLLVPMSIGSAVYGAFWLNGPGPP